MKCGGQMVRPLGPGERKARLDTYIDQEVDKALREFALKEGLPIAYIVNKALKEYLEKEVAKAV